jgi:hypothetical protein
MKKVCSKVVTRLLTPEQKEIRMNICVDILQNTENVTIRHCIPENDPNFLDNVITCDESWVFQYDPESKCQAMHWKSPSSPRQKKARQTKSKFKATIFFFSFFFPPPISEGLFTWIGRPEEEVLTTLRERVRRRRPEMWKNGSWVLHQDITLAHNALSVKTFFISKDQALLKGTRFESVNAVTAKATDLMNKLSEDDRQHCF